MKTNDYDKKFPKKKKCAFTKYKTLLEIRNFTPSRQVAKRSLGLFFASWRLGMSQKIISNNVYRFGDEKCLIPLKFSKIRCTFFRRGVSKLTSGDFLCHSIKQEGQRR